MSRRIVLTGGLSGGHTFPLIAVSRALREVSAGQSTIEFLFIGSKGPFETEAFLQEGIPVKFIWMAKWRRYFSLLNYLDVFKFPVAVIQALWHLLVSMPDAVFAKGGAASVPVVIAAWIYRIPVMLHDSDAVAGRANRLMARFATRISIAYDYARQYFPAEKVALTGNPVRQELLAGDGERARVKHALRNDEPVILVVGGSQGARVLNNAVVRILPELLAKHFQVLHVTGEKNFDETVARAGEPGARTPTPASLERRHDLFGDVEVRVDVLDVVEFLERFDELQHLAGFPAIDRDGGLGHHREIGRVDLDAGSFERTLHLLEHTGLRNDVP
ncbi:MAG: glycosyltransferase [Candidatus Moraniibacteriota bacterium]